MKLENVCVVLVEPQGPLNIGSVCRAMMNFGFSDLRLVNPCDGYKGDEAKRMSLKAYTIVDNAGIYSDLSEALSDCHYSMGTTRRFGKYRENFLLPDTAADQVAALPNDSRVAFVFGREDHGLSTSELDQCQHFITIPTVEAYASMNLSHAVSLCLYEVRKRFADGEIHDVEGITPAEGKNIEQMFQHMRKTLLDIEYLDPSNPDHILRTFRRIFGRTILNDRDVRVLQGLWSRIDWVEGERKKLS